MLPARIETEEEGNARHIESIIHESLDKLHPLHIIIGEKTLRASSFRFDQSKSFPHTNCFPVYVQKIRNDAYCVERLISHGSFSFFPNIL